MESLSTPPSLRSNPSSQTKSASRLARITYSIENEGSSNFSLDLVPSPTPKKTPTTPSVSVKPSANGVPLCELLLLSSSPCKRSRTRLADRLEMAEEGNVELIGSRKKCRSRNSMSGLGCGSPRNRRIKRRSELETSREERHLTEEIGKLRKRRHSNKSKKENNSFVAFSSCPPKAEEDCHGGDLERLGMVFHDLVMWKDVAKSSLWFGLGCICFLSSCFAKGINFSIFSAISQLGLLFLGASFFSNFISQRNYTEKTHQFKLKEEDILRLGRLILPPANLAISKTRELFSGEPSMTLKVTPFLLLGAEYGYLITLRRQCALGFFISFTIPKLYSCYSNQINQKVEYLKSSVLDAMGACSHKKIVAASAITAFWYLSSVKTRVLAAFISLVILRCCRQQILGNHQEEEEPYPQQALVIVKQKKNNNLVSRT